MPKPQSTSKDHLKTNILPSMCRPFVSIVDQDFDFFELSDVHLIPKPQPTGAP